MSLIGRYFVALGDERAYSYRNVSDARSIGVEGALLWTSQRRLLTLQAATTYQDQRNRSTGGGFAAYRGDRIPNRPWFFANWGASLRLASLFDRGDVLEPFYAWRYTHSFYRGWASIGFKQFKDLVPSQLNHDLGVTYGWSSDSTRLHLTIEVQNLTDAKLYDTFGVQRPGRAVYAKLSGDL